MVKLKRYKTLLVWLVVFGLLVFLHGAHVLRPVENFLSLITKPLSGYLYSVGRNFNHNYTARQNQTDLTTRLDTLEKQVAELTVANANCQETATENVKLRAQANFLATNNWRAVTAGIIGQEGAAEAGEASRDLVINRGANDGLRIGLAVADPSGTIVGKITALKDTSARICLTTSLGCKLAAMVQNQSQTQGVTDGDLGLTIKMNYIPQTEKINAGATVVTSGLGANIPRGLVIGRVKEVRSESNAVWTDATIEPLVDFNNLTIVSIIIP